MRVNYTTKLLLLGAAFFLCTSLVKAQNTKGQVNINSPKEVDDIVSQRITFNKKNKGVKGYRIQLFYGSEKGAYKLKDEFNSLFPELKTIIAFSSPDWKVQVGNYITRIEADSALVAIKKEFPSAIILPTKIEVK